METSWMTNGSVFIILRLVCNKWRIIIQVFLTWCVIFCLTLCFSPACLTVFIYTPSESLVIFMSEIACIYNNSRMLLIFRHIFVTKVIYFAPVASKLKQDISRSFGLHIVLLPGCSLGAVPQVACVSLFIFPLGFILWHFYYNKIAYIYMYNHLFYSVLLMSLCCQ